jgi:hypothetical protein
MYIGQLYIVYCILMYITWEIENEALRGARREGVRLWRFFCFTWRTTPRCETSADSLARVSADELRIDPPGAVDGGA